MTGPQPISATRRTRFDPEMIQQPASLRLECFRLIDQTLLLGSAAADKDIPDVATEYLISP